MSRLIALLKSKPEYLGDHTERYIIRIIEFRDVFYVDLFGVKRSSASLEALDLTYCVVDFEKYLIYDASNELSPYSSFHDAICRQTTRYYKDLKSWQKDCVLSNYSLDPNGIPLPPQSWEWDMKKSSIDKKLLKMQLQR